MSSNVDITSKHSHHHHHKKKKHHKKHKHKKHHKKHHTEKLQHSEPEEDEIILDDERLLNALKSIDNDLLNGCNSNEETTGKDESTGQQCLLMMEEEFEQSDHNNDCDILLHESEGRHTRSTNDELKSKSKSKKQLKSKHHTSKRHDSRRLDSRSRRRDSRSRKHYSSSRRHDSRSRKHYSSSRRHDSRSRKHYSSSRRHDSRSISNDSRSRKHYSRSRHSHRSRRDYSSSSDRSRYRSRSDNTRSETDNEANHVIPVLITKSAVKEQKIAQLTEFCRHLSELEKVDDTNGGAVDEPSRPVQHPFELKTDLVYHNDTWKTTNLVMEQRPVEEKFPVSSGINHKKESVVSMHVPVNEPISDLVVQRAAIQQQLRTNDNDVQMILALDTIDKKLASWGQGQLKPGIFTGEKEISPMPKWEHDRGYQAWAKKNMFKDLLPVQDGFGMKMLKKMGWEIGKPLGKTGEGHTEPIPVNVKIDRQGLATVADKPKADNIPSNIPTVMSKTSLTGKHPVSALQELCAKKGWKVPSYKIISETGPAHMKSFMYKVIIDEIGMFQAVCSSNNKKLAKAQAAISCLKSLGLIDDDKKETS